MVKEDYAARLKLAMSMNQPCSKKALAAAVGVSVQAINKYAAGTSGAMTSRNNAKAAAFLRVDPVWLATGEGEARSSRGWPLSADLLEMLHAADARTLRRAENAARSALDMPALPIVDAEQPTTKQTRAA